VASTTRPGGSRSSQRGRRGNRAPVTPKRSAAPPTLVVEDEIATPIDSGNGVQHATAVAPERPRETVDDEATRPAEAVAPVVGAPWLSRELALYGGLVLLSLVFRLIALGDKPLHHDESLHATYTWYLYRGRGYQYDPMMHGPFQFLITAFIFVLAGVSDFTARLLPAFFGAAIVGLPWFLRRELGRAGAICLAIILAASPSFLYFSRFERNDIYIAFFTLAIVAVFFRFLERPRGIHVVFLGALWSLSFTSKENTFITAFVFGLFVIAVVGWELTRRPGAPTADAAEGAERRALRPLIDSVRRVGLDPFVYALTAFAVIFTLFFTTVFTHPQGLLDGLTKSIQYWMSQQPVARGSEPWFYYLVIVPAYEPLAILFGLAGCVLAVKRTALGEWLLGRAATVLARPSTGARDGLVGRGVGQQVVLSDRPVYWGSFLPWFAVGSLVVYSWAGEKMPWLVLHVLLPWCLLAAWMLNWLWLRRQRALAKAAFAVAGLLAVYMVHSAALLSYVNPANPVEMLVYVQTSTDVTDVVQQIQMVARRSGQGYSMPIVIDSKDSWPFVWYLRDFKAVGYPGSMNGPQTAPVVIVADEDNGQVAPLMSDYVVQKYKLRVWWVEQPMNQSDPGKWLRWALWREPWNTLGSYDFDLYLRHDLATGP